MKRMTLSTVAVAAAIGASLVVGVGGASAAGMTGSYIAGEANCEPSRIQATTPGMWPSVSTYSSGSTFVLGGSQRVGHRAHLARLNEATGQWVTVASGSWKIKDVALQGDPGVNSYLDLSTMQWGTGSTMFGVLRAGVYRIFYELYWYANQFVSAGHITTWASAHREYRHGTYNYGAYTACRY